ncbi:Chromo domain-containing protein 1 [Pleurostoma richardsiae]|uniref:Chromo domain-containing protein 1 n=1 Tax=Pleurostoma richardsiae TaxID=41990 RepID=A0AA38VBS5_9PEZI|nr:Chromo domain-containing protein 1 [Pleurostoma richardsiae]
MVSEPQRTFDFFHWFFKYRAQTSAFKLVLARDVREFIRSVAEEKTARRASLLQDRQYSIVEQNLQANLRAVTETDCRAVWQTFHMLWLNLDLREERNGPYAALEENGPIIYADACIDANDEQSLVNWFGWWSMLRADQYRKFYVVGSSIKMTALRAMRGVRTLDIPNYSHTSINNPDTLLEKLEYHEPAQEATTVLQQTDHGAPQLQRPWRFESERFEENSRTWAEWLGGLDHPAPWRLYQYPVSWPSFEQADHFGDTRGEFKRFEDWFSWARPFLKDDLRRFNSYVGFFYTIPGEWDPSLYPQSKRPKRHAWIGIYRPVNCYWKKEPYKKCEVIIWDVSASDKLQNKDVISEADLTPMQRELIRFLRKAGSKKNPGTYIHQVWLGGPKHPPTQSQFPFDLTAMFLEDMMGDIRTYLPAPEHAMPARGYRKLGPDGSSEPMLATAKTNGHQIEMSSNTSEPMDIDPTLDGISEEPTDAKIIFHPPRGTKLASREPTLTKCHNYLYESVRLARLRDKTTQTIEYVYKPTLEWYADQKAEGRSFEHITIDTWETIFSVLKIGSAEPSKDQERKASVDSSINSIDGKVNEE